MKGSASQKGDLVSRGTMDIRFGSDAWDLGKKCGGPLDIDYRATNVNKGGWFQDRFEKIRFARKGGLRQDPKKSRRGFLPPKEGVASSVIHS